jgi:hypothetical protein
MDKRPSLNFSIRRQFRIESKSPGHSSLEINGPSIRGRETANECEAGAMQIAKQSKLD